LQFSEWSHHTGLFESEQNGVDYYTVGPKADVSQNTGINYEH
jgi:hypothetical protein